MNILLVEDNEDHVRLIKRMLAEGLGGACDLKCESRLSGGLQCLAAGGIDVVLLDLTLPDAGGVDTFVKTHQHAPAIPIVVLSANDDEAIAINAVQQGAQDYLIKGRIDSHLLVRALRYAIERKRLEQRLLFLANHDNLTNLPNRLLMADRLHQALSRAPWRKRTLAVLLLDLDHFKRINDTLGHTVGDHLLQAVAKRLGECLRDGDTVARLGGDEFAILLLDMASAQDVPVVVQKILEAFGKPFVVKEQEIFVTTSIGVSLYPNDGKDTETLLKHADIAMYRAKELGRNNYQLFSPEINVMALERLALETDLRRALERNELSLHYQPRVDLATRRINGMEALLRWHHPTRGAIPPGTFIPIAEQTGLILPIGQWVLRAACAQNKAWQEAGLPQIRVSVNVSTRQFHQQRLAQLVADALNQARLEPRFLELELTESLMEEAEETIKTLRVLKFMGIELSIDDFGTGYSSLSYLKRFPVDRLKIDQSFMRDLTTDRDNVAIVTAVIALARTMNLTVLAEGVETDEQMELLRGLRCDEGQGYLFCRPLPPDEAARALSRGSL
ncbi:MAG: EAL domain-containing protein [Nitrospirota bacterium]